MVDSVKLLATIIVIAITAVLFPTGQAYPLNYNYDANTTQQVLFEKVGYYVGTAIYVHVHIKLPTIPFAREITDLLNSLEQHANMLIAKIKNSKQISAIDKQHLQITMDAIDQIKLIYTDMASQLSNLPEHSRDKRQLAILGTILGTIGTLFGGFNRGQLNEIQSTLADVHKKQNLLVDIVQINTKHIENLEISNEQMNETLQELLLNNPATLQSKIQLYVFKAVRAANIINQAIQQAQNHRLSTTLIDASTLKQLFQEVQQRSVREYATLMINNPSDLFQLDCSYIHNKDKSISLIVHVPMARKNQIFNLHQHIPIPLSQSFATNLTITPKLDSNYIAIGPEFQYRIMSNSDLATCKKMGEYFFCNGRDVVQTDLENTCLGALFKRDINNVLSKCEFELGEPKEKVYTVGRNDYIITTLEPFEANKICYDKPHTTISIDRLTRIKIEEGCELRLKNNVIQPDLNIMEESSITFKNINWNLELLFPGHKMETLHETLTNLKNQGVNVISAHRLANLNINDAYLPDPEQIAHPNMYLYTTIIIFIILLIIAGYYCYEKKISIPRTISRLIAKASPAPAPTNFTPPSFQEIRDGTRNLQRERGTGNIYNPPTHQFPSPHDEQEQNPPTIQTISKK